MGHVIVRCKAVRYLPEITVLDTLQPLANIALSFLCFVASLTAIASFSLHKIFPFVPLCAIVCYGECPYSTSIQLHALGYFESSGKIFSLHHGRVK
jgi:hypothetical protein